MEAEWPSAEFHCPTHRSGMQMSACRFPLFSAYTVSQCHNCNLMDLQMQISSQVSVIKVKIHEATGMAAGKQKLQYEVNFSFNLNSSF